MQRAWIVYYDRHCRLCRAAVRFIKRRDRQQHFRFIPLQTEAGQQIADAVGLDSSHPGSLVLSLDGAHYTRSTAVLRIAFHLRFPWPLLAVGWVIPRPLRDALYDWVARNRYRWFGKYESNVSRDPVDHEVDK